MSFQQKLILGGTSSPSSTLQRTNLIRYFLISCIPWSWASFFELHFFFFQGACQRM